MLNNKKNNKGFTLVELLVVIAIIGILAVVAVPALFKNIEKGKVAELESDISAIRSAALSYYADNSKYPEEQSVVGVEDGPLDKEIESLGNPFKGTYTLSGIAPKSLYLTIDLSGDNATKLSADGAKKLMNDLGNVSVELDTPKPKTTGGSSTDAFINDASSVDKKVKKIKVELINGNK